MYGWAQLVSTVLGTAFAVYHLYRVAHNDAVLRALRVNGEKALLARERVVAAAFVLAMQLLLLLTTIWMLRNGREFRTPVGTVLCMLMMMKTAYHVTVRWRLDRYHHDE